MLTLVFTVFAFVDPTGGAIVGILGLLLFTLLPVAWLVLIIYLCVQGYKERHIKLPLIGNFAEQWAGAGPASRSPDANTAGEFARPAVPVRHVRATNRSD